MNTLTQLLERFYPRVNTRITAPFLLITIIVAGLGVFIVTQLVSSSIADRLNNQLLSSAQAATNAMVEIEQEQLAALRALTFTTGIAEAIADNDVEGVAERLAPITLNNQLDSVVVYDSAQTPIYNIGYDALNGGLIVSPVPEEIAVAGIGRVLTLERDEQGDKFVDVVMTGDDTYFYITAPVVNDENFIVGGIAVGVRASSVLRRLTEQALANLVIYDESAMILATSFRGDPTSLALTEAQQTQLQAELVSGTPFREFTINERPYRLLYSPFEIRSEPIGFLVTALPTDFVVEQVSISRNALIVLFGILFFVVIAIGLLVTRSIVRPINQLVDTTRAIQDGDLSRRVGLRQPDEIGELSSSFDSMAERLVLRNQEVEDLYTHQLEETARRDAILSSISDAVIVRNRENEVVMLNPAAEKLWRDLQSNPEAWHRIINRPWHKTALHEQQTVSVDDERFFSVLATPVSLSGRLLGYITVYRDISEMVRAERLKDEMILQLSHELRTPLSSVRGYVELLQLMNAANFDRQSQSFVDKTVGQLTILERMVNQVIDVSALIAEDIEPEIEIFDVAELLKGAIADHHPHYREKHQHLSLQKPSTPVRIDGDPYLLREVFDHLLRNAHNFTPENGHISVTLDYVDSQLIEIVVIDNGAGIDADDLPRVFDRLYRGQSAGAGETDARGLGLGLFMSKAIIEAHHGVIGIDSAEGKGTIVTIELPIKFPESLLV
ncbi:MAG: ATP-binding protein [Chloroflexota bacterium]